MVPKIWLRSAKRPRPWGGWATDDKGTLDIFRIVNRVNVLPGTLILGDMGAYEGMTIAKLREACGSTVGESMDSAVLVEGDPKPGRQKLHHGFLFDGDTWLTDTDLLTPGQMRFFPKKLIGLASEGMNARLDSYCTRREETALKLCELVDAKGAMLIRALPGSGKTSLLQLVANVNTRDIFEHVYYVNLAELHGKTFEELWERYHPGVDLDRIRSPQKRNSNIRPTLLLVDEGQAGFHRTDLSLWGTLKVVMGGLRPHLRMIVVSAWGSGTVNNDGIFVHTPGNFSADDTVSLWPTATQSVALQLSANEAMELWNSWCQKVLRFGAELASFDDLRDYIFSLTEKQPGLMVHMLDWLSKQGLDSVHGCSVAEKARSLLLLPTLYDSLCSLRSLMTLRRAVEGEMCDTESMRSLLRKLLAEECVQLSLYDPDRKAAANAVKWGQIIEEEGWLSFPSQLHRLYLLRELYCSSVASIDDLKQEGLLAFVCQVIERLDPLRLKSSQSRSAADNSVYERQHQNEFYRAACTIIPKTAFLSPDVGPLFGAKGFLDYLLSPCGWGFELMRDGAKLEHHTRRFSPGGTYDRLIQDKVVVEYVILDFRMKPLLQLESCHALLHVVFSNDFKTATLHTLGSEPQTLCVGGGCPYKRNCN